MGLRRRSVTKTGRNEYSPFVQLPFYLLESAAFLALSPAAVKVLLYLIKRFNGTNNGRIAFGARSGCFIRRSGHIVDQAIGLSKTRIALALRELEEQGFIACTKLSSFGQKKLVKEWRLTWLPTATIAATRDFLKANHFAVP